MKKEIRVKTTGTMGDDELIIPLEECCRFARFCTFFYNNNKPNKGDCIKAKGILRLDSVGGYVFFVRKWRKIK